jgi:CSLREA domain-containing protein
MEAMRLRRSKLLSLGLRQGRLVIAWVLALGMLAVVPPRAALAATFTVTKTADTNDGTCDADCSLREAIRAANAAAGADTISIPAGTFTLTLAGSDDTANLGDLDVTGPLTISGAGQASTIIQAGTTSSNGIDKLFSFNPLGLGAGFAVSVQNLTMRFGRNTDSYGGGNGFGGCFDFDTGSAGTGTLALSNVTVTDCSTSDADGGGIALFTAQGGTMSISGSTIQNNKAGLGGVGTSGIGGGIFVGTTNGGRTTNLTISNSTISNNQALSGAKQGGGLFMFGSGGTYNYQLHAVTISGNQAGSDGGGIYSTAPLTIDNVGGPSLISNNSSGRSGGGIWLNHSNQTSTISKVTISNNSAVDGGGGIRLDSSSSGNVLNLSFSRIVNNTAAGGRATGLSVNNGTANADNNWWGCSTGPSAAPCDTAKVDPASGGGPAGAGSVDFNPWLRVLTTATPSTIVTNQSTSLTASVNTNSNGQDVSANNDLLKSLPVTWSAVGGTISGAQTTIQPSGTATATYQATAANVGNLVAAKVDNDGTTTGSNVALITVNKAPTTTTITSDTPDPTVTGEPFTVSFSVLGSQGNSPTAPTGSVTVSDGVNSCTGTLAAGQCTLVLFTAGNRTLTATYSGDSNFNGSTSAGVAHTVNKADTTTTITADNPDPSVTGQPVTVQYSVSVDSPGSGTPTGNVTVSDGTQSCTGTVAAGQCTIAFTSTGAKSLTATYAGDANYNGSTSASVSHQVNKANTATTITSDLPDPSTVGQVVTVQYSVVAVAPGAGTPTGNVTVSDGTDSCTGTVAAGQCTITLTTPGSRPLTATYAGDSNFNGSTSASAPHTVNKIATTTTITSDTPDPSVVGQAVTVQFSVAISGPGSGTPTGNVTVSDGTASCTGTVAAGQCTITFTSAGAKSLTATYAGDSNFNGSTSAAVPHQVDKADTTTTITSDTPDPSLVGEAVTVQYSVTVDSPGSGTPTGNVTVSDGTASCTGTVAAGQCTITFASAGAKSLTATYAGDSNYNGSTSAAVSHQVDKADTTTTITADNPDPSSVGQVVTVQYSVTVDSPGSGTPTGNVTVTDGTVSCTGTVAAGQCTITFTSGGSKTLTATYAGDSNFNGSTSAGEPHSVDLPPTTTTITSDNPDPSVVGQAVMVQFSVTSTASGTPTGNVTVSDGTDSCTGTVAAGQCTITFTSAGAKTLTATYAGDSSFSGSTSAVEPHQVDKADTTTTVTGDAPDPSMVGEAVTVHYSVTVDSPGSGTPTGNVTVSDGTDSCTGTVAAGQCTITFTSAGAKTLMATYAGDSNFNGSTSAAVSHQVNKGLTTTTITSDTPDPSAVGQAVTIQYSVTVNSPGSGTPTGNVTVSDGTDSCTGTVAAGQCTITFTSVGNKTLIATYAGDADFSGGPSPAEPHRVNQNGSTTTISSDTPDPSVVGQAVTVQYSVTPGGSGTPTGNVTVSDGTDSCTGTVAAGQCSLTLTTAGARSLTANYAGDSNFGGSISAAEPHQVDKGDTTTTISSDTPDPSAVGQVVTVQYSVAVSGLGSGTPTGNVTVSDGTDSCTGTVAAGQCTITFTSPGAKTLTATYAGDSNFNGSTSAGAPHTVTINHAPTAQPDSHTTSEDTPLSVTKPGVLANDSDTDTGDTLTAVLGSGPSHAAAFTLNADGSFSYTPNPNFNGSDSFTYMARDNHNADSAAATVTINVTAVNDAPSFTKGPDVTVTAAAGPYSAAWATAISAGPANESGQGLTFLVTGNTNPGLFSAAPAIAANGTLTFTPAPNANGQATITVVLKDNAGTANGGQDTSAPQSFTITVTSQWRWYLPIITHPAVATAPDLVVTGISLIPNKSTFAAGEPVEVRVTVKNQGSAAAGAFWVDLYINPSSPPTAANQVWNTRCGMTPCFGMAWTVTSGLAPGQSITLSSLSLPAGYSIWPGYFAAGTSDLYAYADSFSPGVVDGAVAESDETNNRAELHGLSVTGPNPSLVGLQRVTDLLARPLHLRK